jgi:hypothetical protein
VPDVALHIVFAVDVVPAVAACNTIESEVVDSNTMLGRAKNAEGNVHVPDAPASDLNPPADAVVIATPVAVMPGLVQIINPLGARVYDPSAVEPICSPPVQSHAVELLLVISIDCIPVPATLFAT